MTEELIQIPENEITNTPRFQKLLYDIEINKKLRDELIILINEKPNLHGDDIENIINVLSQSGSLENQLLQTIYILCKEIEKKK